MFVSGVAMSKLFALACLVLAALLEAGGDALVRRGMPHQGILPRAGFLGLGAAALFAYGVFVNTPPWDFGRLLGVYVAIFFVAAQAINFFAFNATPGWPVVAGGTLIILGGLVMTVWQ